jgi:hypothetical protein
VSTVGTGADGSATVGLAPDGVLVMTASLGTEGGWSAGRNDRPPVTRVTNSS